MIENGGLRISAKRQYSPLIKICASPVNGEYVLKDTLGVYFKDWAERASSATKRTRCRLLSDFLPSLHTSKREKTEKIDLHPPVTEMVGPSMPNDQLKTAFSRAAYLMMPPLFEIVIEDKEDISLSHLACSAFSFFLFICRYCNIYIEFEKVVPGWKTTLRNSLIPCLKMDRDDEVLAYIFLICNSGMVRGMFTRGEREG